MDVQGHHSMSSFCKLGNPCGEYTVTARLIKLETETGLEKLFVGTWLNIPCFEPENTKQVFVRVHAVSCCRLMWSSYRCGWFAMYSPFAQNKHSWTAISSSVESSAFHNPSRT